MCPNNPACALLSDRLRLTLDTAERPRHLSMAFKAFLALPQAALQNQVRLPAKQDVLGLPPPPRPAKASPPIVCFRHSFCPDNPALSPHLNPTLPGRHPRKAPSPTSSPCSPSAEHLQGGEGLSHLQAHRSPPNNCLLNSSSIEALCWGPREGRRCRATAPTRIPPGSMCHLLS